MIYITSSETDPYFNLAFEEYIFNSMSKEEEYFLLWQNDNTIVVGKHQNTIEEINSEFVKEKNIKVVRRLSGGGAVYHDIGNLNFTFIVSKNGTNEFDFRIFTEPVIKALAKIGIKAEFNSRNDIVIDGKKFSGNSQYIKRNRVLHHGTLLFNSKLDTIQNALNVKKDKIESKGIKSVKSRVTNVSDCLKEDISIGEFKELLLKHMFEDADLKEYKLAQDDIKAIEKLRDEKYSTWEWNYGQSPKYNLRKERKFDSGLITILMEVRKGKIVNIKFYGDFFGNGNISDLEEKLINKKIEETVLMQALDNVNVGYYIRGIDADKLVNLILC